MKNPKLLLTFILFFTFISVHGQFKIGVAGGVNSNSFNGDIGSSHKTGWHVGAITEFKLPVLLGVEADFLYTEKGAKVSLLGVEESQDLNYLDIPIMGKLYLLKVLSIQAGVQYSFLLNASQGNVDVKDNYNSSDFSYMGGVGLDLGKLHGSLRYTESFSSISENSQVDIKNRAFVLTAGFWFK
jgi:hypothetical protein